MSVIAKVNAYANNEVGYIAWTLSDSIPGCLGFEISRIYVSGGDADAPDGTERVLAAWVPFTGQDNPKWLPQTTAVWPVQKLTWRDLTVRQRRDRAELRKAGVTLKYRVRAVVPAVPGLTPVANIPAKNYDGDTVPLAYVDDGLVSDEITITSQFGNLQVSFNNGILSTQWLKHTFETKEGKPLSAQALRPLIGTPGNIYRKYLTGDALPMLKQLLECAAADHGEVYLALYELGDRELVDLIVANAPRVHLILSNSSAGRTSRLWDEGNADNRKIVHKANLAEMIDRMFNNRHIGHNKFVVYVQGGKPKSVLTGSTNWTPNGLCAQSNNQLIIQDETVAGQYLDYWHALKLDTEDFAEPSEEGAATSNKQGKDLRAENAGELPTTKVDSTTITPWRSPNTLLVTKGTKTPPDLSAVYSLMRKAKHAIFFAVFMPSVKGATSIVEEAINLGENDSSLLVYGSVSDPKVMPNYIARCDGSDDGESDSVDEKQKHPATIGNANVHSVRAAALVKGDIVGDCETELQSAGNAIIHDKIVVIDPLSPDCVVITGSHNLGYKASYENDENLVIMRGNPLVAQAYMVHLLDLYEHYRYRASQLEQHNKGEKLWSGFLDRNDRWLAEYMTGDKRALSQYLGR